MPALDRVVFTTTREGSVTVMPGWRLGEAERQDAIPAVRATWLLQQLGREGNRPVLAALYELATGTNPGGPGRVVASALVTKICAALESGKLVAVRNDGRAERAQVDLPRAAGKTISAEQKLISAVMTGRAALSFEGVRYRLVAAEAGAEARGYSEYAPVTAGDASELIKRIGASVAKSNADRALWADVEKAVARPRETARIVLLRPRPARYAPAPAPEAPAPAPARAAVATQTWIEIEVVFDDGTPFSGNCAVDLPGGVRTDGAPDGEGLIRIERIDPGSCKVSFPGLDASAWGPA